ncbi:DinB family protein [Lapillicoccus sp.]|uniref:DinB family protein n=1 Tax=Lapillicoccus sp. TaxID=1909287 RepID=UPI003263B1CF
MPPSEATVYPDMWVDPENDPRDNGTTVTDEKSNLVDYLRAYRLTLKMKCDGLDAEQLAMRSVPPSTLSLLGLVRHMAKVEQSWFRRCIAEQDVPRLYESEDRDHDFNGAVPDREAVVEAFATWQAEILHAEELLAAENDMGRVVRRGDEEVSVRDVVVHMIEEYARHCGHADLLRECVDGRTGQ